MRDIRNIDAARHTAFVTLRTFTPYTYGPYFMRTPRIYALRLRMQTGRVILIYSLYIIIYEQCHCFVRRVIFLSMLVDVHCGLNVRT